MQDEAPRARLRRSEAAAYARRRLGQSVKVNTLRNWPIPYRQVGRDAVYEISDLDRFIEARLAAAPLRRAPGGQQIGAPDYAAVYETFTASFSSAMSDQTRPVCGRLNSPSENTAAAPARI